MSALLLELILCFKVDYYKIVILLSLCFGLTSCEIIRDTQILKVFEKKNIPTATVNQLIMRERSNKEIFKLVISATPSLSSVPLRPKNITSHSDRKKILNQLYLDRRNAQLNNDLIKLQEKLIIDSR
jgi:hypothetical protein